MKLTLFISAIFFLTQTMGLKAQESLSLSQAIQTGLQNNFDIKIQKINQEIAHNNNNAGEAGRFPTITFDVNQNNNININNNPASFLQGTVITNSIVPSINARWVIFNGFSVKINKERLELLEEQSAGNATLVIENAIQSIIIAYYNILLEQERLDVFQKTLTLSRDRYQHVMVRNELGTSVTFDILQEKNAYLLDSTNLVNQQLNLKNAYRNLNLLINAPINNTYNLTDSLPEPDVLYNLEALNQKMTSNNQNLKNQYINLALQQQNVGLSKAALYPRIDFGLGASYTYNRQDLSNAKFVNNEGGLGVTSATNTNYYGNFTLSFTLFNGGRVRRQIKNARLQENIAEIQVDQMKLSLYNDLLAAYDLFNVRKSIFAITKENIEAAELNLSLGEERFESGIINSFDYRTLQLNYLTVSLNHLQAQLDLIQSDLSLLRLTGGILQEYTTE